MSYASFNVTYLVPFGGWILIGKHNNFFYVHEDTSHARNSHQQIRPKMWLGYGLIKAWQAYPTD